MNAKRLGWLGILLVMVLSMLTACQSSEALYRGKQVAREHAVPLAPGPASGSWETFDVVVRYTYAEDAGRLVLQGTVAVADHYQLTYEILDQLELELVLLDREARVVATRDLDIGRPLGQLWQMGFDEQLVLPDGVTAFSFAYEGVVRGGGDDHADAASFWLAPY